MTVALVTGGHGFVGSHLRPLLRARGWDVVSIGRTEREAPAGERYFAVDVARGEDLAQVLDAVRPDVVFHLAASTGRRPGQDSVTVIDDTLWATYHLCLELRRQRSSARVVVVGSSAQYGDVPEADNPVFEETACRPLSPYGFAKAAAEATAAALAIDATFDVVFARPFNHIGPGESVDTVSGALAQRSVAVLTGKADRIDAANLGAVRDFTDVRDVSRAYMALAEHGTPGRVYNVCSGKPTRIDELLDMYLAAANLDRSVVRVAETGAGPAGIRYQVGSPARIERELDWRASIALEQSVSDQVRALLGPTGTSHAS